MSQDNGVFPFRDDNYYLGMYTMMFQHAWGELEALTEEEKTNPNMYEEDQSKADKLEDCVFLLQLTTKFLHAYVGEC